MKPIFYPLTTFLITISSLLLAQPTVTKIGVIGCHSQDAPAPAIPYMANTLKPDYVLWVGDNVYADTDNDAQHIMRQLEKLAAKPGYADLKANSKFYVTWDDHDFGRNDAGGDYPLKEQTKEVHRKFWELEKEIPVGQDGVYYARVETQPNGKKIQFIMLDGRYNRDNPKKRNADALGEAQWAWLETQLKEPADLRFMVNGYQFLLQHPTRWEAWIKIGKSRDRLMDLLKKTGAKPVIFITGDQHYVEVLKSGKNVPYKSYEIMAAGINQTEKPGIARNRVAGPDLTIHDASLIEVHWEAAPYILFRNHDIEGNKISLEYRINLSEIGWEE